MLARLDARLHGVAETTPVLGGPDPGPAPWHAWPAATAERFGTASARGAARLAAGVTAAAVEALRSSPRESLLGDALLRLGRELRHAGRRCAARAALTEALAIAERTGIADLSDLARAELHVAGARPRRERCSGPDALTPAERRAADAAASGATNREIAERFFLSPKTIEMHLGRAYRKLGIASRADLARVLGKARHAAA
jgi:DNA-binding CsgD family transcriptional regulator